MPTHTLTVFILSASSDIGRELAQRYLADGYRVIGTYRTHYDEPEYALPAAMHAVHCDIEQPESIQAALQFMRDQQLTWDIFISCVGELRPVGLFFATDFNAWQRSVDINAMHQLRVVHALYPLRTPDKINTVCFFAGGGTNNPFRYYSAYCLGKIALIKMCELLDDEAHDLNVFISGPGWTNTKGHEATLEAKERAGENYDKTLTFIDSGKSGTSHDTIYQHIQWGIAQGREVAGGRNFSIVHDPWERDETLPEALRADANKYKLRRSSNDGPLKK